MDLSGKLLVAMPALQDPRFDRAVIFICSHSPEGAMGLIVNHPLPDVPFTALLDGLGIAGAAGVAPDVHYGGPVERARGFILHRDTFASDAPALNIAGGYHLSATLDVLELLAKGAGPDPALLALGYAGWGPGQLEAEIAENSWLTLDGLPDIIFATKAQEKWSRALQHMGITPLALSSAAGRA
jgi:putative transcriptional regulator